MNIVIIYPHLSSSISDEHLTYERSIREQYLSDFLVNDGINIELWLLTNKKEIFSFPEKAGSPKYYPVDYSLKKKNNKWFTSEPLKIALINQKPDIVIFKGLGYYLPYWLYKNKALPEKIGFIVGGNDFDILLPVASYVFTEFDFQLTTKYKFFYKKGFAQKLNKLIPDSDFIRINKKDCDIISIGDLSYRKNHRALLPLAKKWKIKIIGDGPLRNELVYLFKDYSQNVTFLGSLTRNEIPKHIATAKIMVHPSLSEGFPRVFAESFACGVPVIAIKKAIHGEFPDNYAGKLINLNDLETEVDSVLKSSDLLSQFSLNAMQIAESNFKGSIVSKQFKDGIYKIISKKKKFSIYFPLYKYVLFLNFIIWTFDYLIYHKIAPLKRLIIKYIKRKK